MAEAQSVDVDTFVNELKFNLFHVRVLAIATTMMMIDGYDLALVGWVLPNLAASFGVAPTAITGALVTQQIGMVVGAYFIAPQADRFGRRPVLLFAVIGIAISCSITTFAHDVATFALCRLVTGMFASTIIATLVALTTDISPARLRGTISTVVLTGSMGGAMLGALMQAFVLESYGWRGAFWIGAFLPVAMLPIIYFFLPESLRFLVGRGRRDARFDRIVHAMRRGVAQPIVITEPVVPMVRATAREFLRYALHPERRTGTILLWLLFVCSFLFISTFSGWSTTLYKQMDGLNWQQLAVTTALYTGFGAIGTLTAGVMIDRWGFKKVLPTLFLAAGVGVIVIGTTSSTTTLFAAIAAMAFFQVGAHSGMSALAGAQFEARWRASGVGWAYGAGRVTSILGPMLGATLIHLGTSKQVTFALLGLPLLAGGLLPPFLLRRARL